MIKKIASVILTILLVGTILSGQTVTLTGNFNRFITYYVSSVDINTGSSDVQIFRYRLSSDSYPVSVKVNFIITILSPALGLTEPTPLIEVETKVFEMVTDIDLDNRDLSTENLVIYDVQGNEVDISPEVKDQLDFGELEDLFSVIVQTGRLPDGVYSFRLTVFSDDDTPLATEEQVINVTPSMTLQLTSPGGTFEELVQNEIYTTYPVFQWESEMFSAAHVKHCSECGFFIRVAEFIFEDHTTIEDAIEDISTLPLDQVQAWHLVGDEDGNGLWEEAEASGNQLSFMYPTANAVDLLPGGIYVWQIQKRISTTEGIETINSPIFAFMIKETTVNPIMQALQGILPEQLLQAFFTPGGPLTGYSPTGTFMVDGVEGDMSILNALSEEFRQGTRTIITAEVQP